MNDENPFRTLGVPVQFAMSLTPKQLKAFVKDVYRSLQKLYHPDKGGSNEQSQKINEAMRILEDETAFMMSWHEFISNPDPLAGPRIKEIEALRSELSTLRGRMRLLELDNREKAAREAELEEKVHELRVAARERLQDRMTGNDDGAHEIAGELQTSEIVYLPLVGDIVLQESRVLYASGDIAMKLNEKGKEVAIGRIMGTIPPSKLGTILDEIKGGRINAYGIKAKDTLALALGNEFVKGSALVCRAGPDSLTMLGIIESVRETTMAKSKAMIEERRAHMERFKEIMKGIQANKGADPVSPLAGIAEFNGLLRINGGKHLIVRRNTSVRYIGNGGWENEMRLAGSVKSGRGEEFMRICGEPDPDLRRKRMLGFFKEGGLTDEIAAGNHLIGVEDGLPTFIGTIELVRPADKDRMAQLFDGVVIPSDDSPKLLLKNGKISEVSDGSKLKGNLIGSVIDPEGFGLEAPLMVPWVEDKSPVVFRMPSGQEWALPCAEKILVLKHLPHSMREEIISKAMPAAVIEYSPSTCNIGIISLRMAYERGRLLHIPGGRKADDSCFIEGCVKSDALEALGELDSKGKTYINRLKAEKRLDPLLVRSLEIGDALLYRDGKTNKRSLRALGTIRSITNVPLADAKKMLESCSEDMQSFSVFWESVLASRDQEKGMFPDYYPEHFFGTLRLEGAGTDFIVRDGRITALKGARWLEGPKLLGTVGDSGDFIKALEGLAESAMRREIMKRFSEGGLQPEITEGAPLFCLLDGLPALLGNVAESAPIKRCMLAENFYGSVSVPGRGNLFASKGVLARISEGMQSPIGDLRGGIRKDGIAVPWLEEGGKVLCSAPDATTLTLGPAHVESFDALSSKDRMAKKEELGLKPPLRKKASAEKKKKLTTG